MVHFDFDVTSPNSDAAAALAAAYSNYHSSPASAADIAAYSGYFQLLEPLPPPVDSGMHYRKIIYSFPFFNKCSIFSNRTISAGTSGLPGRSTAAAAAAARRRRRHNLFPGARREV